MRSAPRRCPGLRSPRDDRRAPRLARHRAPRCAAHRQHSPCWDGSRSNSSRLSSVRGSRARTRIGGSMSSTTLSNRSARHWCERGSRARSSTSIAIQAALRFIPAKRRQNLCPTTTFDGEPLYRLRPSAGRGRDRRAAASLLRSLPRGARRRDRAPAPEASARRALFDAHSIRSVIPRLFDGELPVFNLGTNSGASCDPELRETVGAVLAASGQTSIVDGASRAAGSRAPSGSPSEGVEALQLELACRAYMHEPERPYARELANADRRKARRRRARRSSAFSRRSFGRSAAHEDDRHCHSRRERSAIGNPISAEAATRSPVGPRYAESDNF